MTRAWPRMSLSGVYLTVALSREMTTLYFTGAVNRKMRMVSPDLPNRKMRMVSPDLPNRKMRMVSPDLPQIYQISPDFTPGQK